MARSQNDRVLAQLRRGPVNPSQFLGAPGQPVRDGLAPIQRLAPRIHVLRSRGHRIESVGRDEHGCAIYRLARESAPQYTDAAEANGGSDGRGAEASRPSPFKMANDSPSGEPRGGTAVAGADPCEAEPKPGAGDASDSQHGLHNVLDFEHRRGCEQCADHYADLAADAADDNWDEAAA